MLINHYGHIGTDDYSNIRALWRREEQQHVRYAIFDFDISVIFPATLPPAKRRLPSNLSFQGTFDRPHDTMQGELDYDPFTFDVGCLGVLFCNNFHVRPPIYNLKKILTYADTSGNYPQVLIPLVPMLAPLLDRMTTRHIQRRFTALQALQFFDEHVYPSIPEDLLRCLPPPHSIPDLPYDESDRWFQLPDDFVESWHHFQEPKLSRWTRLLRDICANRFGRATVMFIRRIIGLMRVHIGNIGNNYDDAVS